MRYLLLIYGDESTWKEASDEERAETHAAYGTVMAQMEENGVMLGGAELRGSDTATTVRVRGGERQLTDGPFAETKEVLGGYFLVECEDVDEAIEWAARIPTAAYGSIEVRPLVERQ
jgi:hypothetical protein